MSVCAPRRRKSATTARLSVECLEDRSVPAVVNLTTAGASGFVNGVAFLQANPQPTGVGVIHDFLRIQSQQGAVEQGYNSDARPVQFDEKASPPFDRAIHLSDLPTVTANGVTYRVFLLGVNQSQSSPLISLDELRLYVSGSPTVSGYDPTTQQLGGLTARYDLGANWVVLDSSLSHGNGSGDMLMFVPDSLLASPGNPDPYVYLYSKMGVHDAANGGFEQWAPGTGAMMPPTPPPSASVSGYVYRDVNRDGVRDAGDTGLGQMTIELTGFDAQGNPVSRTTLTNADGSYTFTNLAAGTYQLTEQPPPWFPKGPNSVGTVNGLTDGTLVGQDTIGGIVLASADVGVEYDFSLVVITSAG